MKKILFLLAATTLLLFIGGSNLLFVLFTGNLLPDPRIDQLQAEMSLPIAIFINVLLLILFGLQHSIMARKGFKQRIQKWIPYGFERMFYNIASSIVLVIVIYFWQAIPIVIWNVQIEWIKIALYTLFFLGYFLSFGAAISTDGFRLAGLRQLAHYFFDSPKKSVSFKTPILYNLVRHPLYFGLIIAFWSAPLMTLFHLLF